MKNVHLSWTFEGQENIKNYKNAKEKHVTILGLCLILLKENLSIDSTEITIGKKTTFKKGKAMKTLSEETGYLSKEAGKVPDIVHDQD